MSDEFQLPRRATLVDRDRVALDRLRIGVGIDYEESYLVQARHRAGAGRLYFVTADATSLPIGTQFDLAICMTNS